MTGASTIRRLIFSLCFLSISVFIWISTSSFVFALSEAKIYWTDGNNSGSAIAKVLRANLDGTNVEKLVIPPGLNPRAIALDVDGGKMYWADVGVIKRANLDGSNVEDLINGLPCPMGIALDFSGGQIYWTDCSTSKIQRANSDGSNVEDLVTGLANPGGIALDPMESKLYWTDMSYDNPTKRSIQRANLDGSNVEDLVTYQQEIFWPASIALDETGRRMFWTDDNRIRRANIDGTGVVTLLTLGSPRGIALDVAGGKMYWTSFFPGKILRASLDGTDIQELVTAGLDTPGGIALFIPRADQDVKATISIEPETLNLNSKGVFTAFITLPEGYDVTGININSVECEGAPVIRWNTADDKLEIKFAREDLRGVEPGDEVPFTVSGSLNDGSSFSGTATIRVIGKGKK